MSGAQVVGDRDGLGEVGVGGGFAVTGEGHVAHAAVGSVDADERLPGPDLAGTGEGEHMVQFGSQLREVDVAAARRGGAVDEAVDAVEVAGGVGVKVNANGQAAAATADDGVDVIKVAPGAGVVGEGTGQRRAGRSWMLRFAHREVF